MKRSLITGCAGFVGRHITKRLLDDGHHVTGVDNLSAGMHPNDWPFRLYGGAYPTEFYIEDCRDFFRRSFAGDFDEVYHCAAVVGGRLKIEGDPLAVATDLAIDADFFNWAVRGRNPRRVVYFSSSAVYPIELQSRTRNCALAESMVRPGLNNRIAMPDETYGWAKLSGELLAQYAVDRYGLNVHVFRPFSGYGEDQSLDYPFPAIVRRVLDGEDPVVVWGSGEQTRDWIYIDDIVDIVMTTRDQSSGLVLNLGSGLSTSFVFLAETIAETLSRTDLTIVNDPSKPEGVYARVADTYLLNTLGLKTKITLAEGIRRVARHLDKAMEKV